MLTVPHPPAVLQDVLAFLEQMTDVLSGADDSTLKDWAEQAGNHTAALRGVVARFTWSDERDADLPVHPALRPDAPLSAREERVLMLIARGHSNKNIAASLGLSVKTVEAHKANGAHRLGLYTRVDLVHHAFLVGWLP